MKCRKFYRSVELTNGDDFLDLIERFIIAKPSLMTSIEIMENMDDEYSPLLDETIGFTGTNVSNSEYLQPFVLIQKLGLVFSLMIRGSGLILRRVVAIISRDRIIIPKAYFLA